MFLFLFLYFERSFTHCQSLLTLCIDHLENIGPLNYVDHSNVWTFHYTISKMAFVNITGDLIRKVLKFWETDVGKHTFSKILIIMSKFRFYHWLQIYQLFSMKRQSYLVHLWENVRISDLKNHSLSIVFSSENIVPWAEQSEQLKTQSHKHRQKKCFMYPFRFITHNIKGMSTRQRRQDKI